MTATFKVSEADFTDMVIQYAKLQGWRVCHFRPARTENGWRTALQGDPGWFDIMAGRMDRLILAELKAEGRKQDSAQIDWWNAIAGVQCVELYCWRPSDWSAIEEILK